jgi:4-amino-4-deoxy-L-arabinose transferase-like glycosyltransferase
VGAQSLWYDEGTSAGLATRSLADIARNASNDIHPPLYYVALAGWARIAGHDEAGLRGLSVFAGTILVALVLGLGRRLWGWGEGLAAGLLAAVSPFLIWYSQEARMYMLAAALGTALAWLAVELSTSSPSDAYERSMLRRVAPWALYVALATATLYSHYFVGVSAFAAANMVAAGGVLGSWRRERRVPSSFVMRWVLAQAMALFLFAPWVAVAWHTIADWPALGPRLSSLELARNALDTFALGCCRVPGHAGWLLIPACLALAGIVSGKLPGRRRGTFVAGSMVAAPLAAMWLLSLVRPAWDAKFLIAAAPGFELLMGAGVVVISRWLRSALSRIAVGHINRWAGAITTAAAAVLLLAVLWPRAQALHAMYYDPSYQRDDYRGVAAAVTDQAGPADAVVLNAPTQVELFMYYDGDRHETYPLPPERPPDRSATVARLEDIATKHRDVYAVLWATDESDPEGIVEGWLNAERAKAFDSWFGNVRLAMWAAPRTPQAAARLEPQAFGGHEIGLLRLLYGPADRGESAAAPGEAASAVVEPGGVLTVDAWWAALAPGAPMADYSVFLHLVDEAGLLVAQRDMAPVGGTARTSSWAPVAGLEAAPHDQSIEDAIDSRSVVHDRIALVVPPGTAPGNYRLLIGLYDPATSMRLAVRPLRFDPAEEQPRQADSLEAVKVTVRAPTDGTR